jgi:glutamyl-tRNA reductase
MLERLVNAVIQASKKIKTDTEISSGATGFLPQFVILSTMYKTLETKTFSCLVLKNW